MNEEDNYVAWLRFRRRPDTGQSYLQLCDSDAEGAFKVWRHPDRKAIEAALTVERKRVEALERENERLRRGLDHVEQMTHGVLCKYCEQVNEMVREALGR